METAIVSGIVAAFARSGAITLTSQILGGTGRNGGNGCTGRSPTDSTDHRRGGNHHE